MVRFNTLTLGIRSTVWFAYALIGFEFWTAA